MNWSLKAAIEYNVQNIKKKEINTSLNEPKRKREFKYNVLFLKKEKKSRSVKAKIAESS